MTRRALRKLGSAATALIAVVGVVLCVCIIPHHILMYAMDYSVPTPRSAAHKLLSFVFVSICIGWGLYLVKTFVLGPFATLMEKMSFISAISLARPIWLASALSGAILILPMVLALIPDWPAPIMAVLILGLIACWSWLANCREHIVDETLSAFQAARLDHAQTPGSA